MERSGNNLEKPLRIQKFIFVYSFLEIQFYYVNENSPEKKLVECENIVNINILRLKIVQGKCLGILS